MHDELRGTLARQGIPEETYMQVTGKTHEDIHTEFRPGAEKRVRTLLVLSKIADVEGVDVPEADIEAEIQRARERYGNDRKLIGYFESERGRSYIRSSFRRTRLVEGLIDEWLAAHPEFGPLPHLEDGEDGALASAAAGAPTSAEEADATSDAPPEGVDAEDAGSRAVAQPID